MQHHGNARTWGTNQEGAIIWHKILGIEVMDREKEVEIRRVEMVPGVLSSYRQ